MKRCDNIFDPSISQNTWMYSFQFKTKLQRRSRFHLVSIHLVNHLHPFVLGHFTTEGTATLRNPMNGGRLHNYAPITEEPDLRWAGIRKKRTGASLRWVVLGDNFSRRFSGGENPRGIVWKNHAFSGATLVLGSFVRSARWMEIFTKKNCTPSTCLKKY